MEYHCRCSPRNHFGILLPPCHSRSRDSMLFHFSWDETFQIYPRDGVKSSPTCPQSTTYQPTPIIPILNCQKHMPCVCLCLMVLPNWIHRPKSQSKPRLNPVAEIHIQISFNPVLRLKSSKLGVPTLYATLGGSILASSPASFKVTIALLHTPLYLFLSLSLSLIHTLTHSDTDLSSPFSPSACDLGPLIPQAPQSSYHLSIFAIISLHSVYLFSFSGRPVKLESSVSHSPILISLNFSCSNSEICGLTLILTCFSSILLQLKFLPRQHNVRRRI